MAGNIVQIIIAAKDLTAAAFTKVQTKMGALKGVATKLGGAFKAVAKAGVLIGGAAVLAAIGGGIKAFTDFEDAMANVRKTTGLSKEAIAELGDAIKIMAEKIPVSQTELAKIATIAGQLGISGKEDILSFTESVAMMSVAFEMSAEDVATAMAKLGTIYDIPIENTEKLGSAINVLGNTTAAKEADIINFAMSLGPTARLLGFTATEALAMGASMISIGVDANDAGTRLSRAFTMIGKNIGELSSFVGMAEEEFRKLFEERPMDALTMVVTKLSEVEGKLERNTIASKMFNEVGAKAIKAIAANTDGLVINLKNAEDGFRDGTAVAAEFAAKTDTLKASFQLLKNSITNLLIDIGAELAPGITKLIEVFRDALPKIKEVFFEMGQGAREFAESIVDQVKPAFDGLVEKVKEAGEKMSAGLDFSTLADDIGVFIGVGLKPLIEGFGWLIDKLGPLWDLIGAGAGKFHELANALKTEEGKIDDVRDATIELTNAKQGLIGANETLTGKTTSLADALKDANGWTEKLAALESTAKAKTSELTTARREAAQAIADFGPKSDIAIAAIERVKKAEEEAETATKNYQTALGDATSVLTDTGVASDDLKDKYYDFVDANEAVVTAEGEVIAKTAELKTQMEEAQQAPLDLKAKFTEFGDSVKTTMGEIPLFIAEQFAKIPDIIGGIFTTIGKKIAEFGESLPDFIGGGIVSLGDKFSEMGIAFDLVSEDIITKTETLRDSFKTNIEDPLSEDIPAASEEMQGAFSDAATAMGMGANKIKIDVDAVGTTFEELSKPIGEVAEATGNLQDDIEEDMDKISIDVDGTKVTFEGLKGKVDDVVGEFENFEDIAGKLIGLDWSVFTTLKEELPGIDKGIGDMKTAFEGLKTVLEDNIDNLESIQADLGSIEETITPFVNNIAPGITAIGDFGTALRDTQSTLSTFASMSEIDIKGMLGFEGAVHSMVMGLDILEGQIERLMPSFGDMNSLIGDIAKTFTGMSDPVGETREELLALFKLRDTEVGGLNRLVTALRKYSGAIGANTELAKAASGAEEELLAYVEKHATEEKILSMAMDTTTGALKSQTEQLTKISGAIQPLINFMGTLNELYESVFGEKAAVWDAMKVQEVFAAIEDTIRLMGEELGKVDFGEFIGEALENSKDFRTAMEEDGSQLAVLTSYIDILLGNYVDLAELMGRLAEAEEDMGDETFEVSQAFASLSDYIQGLAVYLPTLTSELGTLNDLWGENGDTIEDSMTSYHKLMSVVKSLSLSFADFTGTMLELSTAQETATALGVDLGRSFEMVVEFVSGLTSIIPSLATELDTLNDIWGENQETVNKGATAFSDAMKPIETISDGMLDLGNVMVIAGDDVGSKFDSITDYIGKLTDYTPRLGLALSGLKTVWDENSGAINDGTTAFSNIVGAISDVQTSIGNLVTAEKNLETAADAATTAVDEESDALAGHSLSTSLDTTVASSALLQAATEALAGTMWPLTDAVRVAAAALSGELVGAMGAAASAMANLAGGAYSSGLSIAYSFADGIYSGMSAVEGAASALGAVVASYLSVHSNTELGALSDLMEWGPNVVKTFKKGIQGEMLSLGKTLNKMSLGGVSVQGGMAGMKGGSSTKTVYMTVHQNIGDRSDADYAVREVEKMLRKPAIL